MPEAVQRQIGSIISSLKTQGSSTRSEARRKCSWRRDLQVEVSIDLAEGVFFHRFGIEKAIVNKKGEFPVHWRRECAEADAEWSSGDG